MKRLGPQPLTGAEKQRRHRERVKARLAEAERLKSLLSGGESLELPGIGALYESLLAEAGATADEREALRARLPAAQAEIRAFFKAKAEADLARLREERRKGRSSLLSRLNSMNRQP
jgi:hypothetical protein